LAPCAERGSIELLRPHLIRADLLEEASEEVAGVVDEHIYPTEAVESRLSRGLRRHHVRDVELDDEQVIRFAERLADGVGPAASRDDRVAGSPSAQTSPGCSCLRR
jgi:hypothetical protein